MELPSSSSSSRRGSLPASAFNLKPSAPRSRGTCVPVPRTTPANRSRNMPDSLHKHPCTNSRSGFIPLAGVRVGFSMESARSSRVIEASSGSFGDFDRASPLQTVRRSVQDHQLSGDALKVKASISISLLQFGRPKIILRNVLTRVSSGR